MKKLTAIIVSVLAFAAVASAQPRALGLRGGFGAEISYQHSVDSNFLEADLGWAPGEANLVAVYDFIFANSGNFNFYAGPGLRVGTFKTSSDVDGINLGVAGQIGVEFQIPSVPINLSLDWRPVVNFFGEGKQRGFCGYYGAFAIRYRF